MLSLLAAVLPLLSSCGESSVAHDRERQLLAGLTFQIKDSDGDAISVRRYAIERLPLETYGRYAIEDEFNAPLTADVSGAGLKMLEPTEPYVDPNFIGLARSDACTVAFLLNRRPTDDRAPLGTVDVQVSCADKVSSSGE
jgi:hypothetical protein